MKKRLLLIPLVMISSLLFAVPCFAGDPPDTQVSVVVVTPGDVDLGVGVTAGGNVGVTIDGVGLGSIVMGAYNTYAANHPTGGRGAWDGIDWYRAWNKEIAPYKELLLQHNDLIGLLAEAEAKLIQKGDLTEENINSISKDISNLNGKLFIVESAMSASLADLGVTISELKNQDEVTWNQLMYGAEAHIAILDTQVIEQSQGITSLQDELVSLKAQNEVQGAYIAGFTVYVNTISEEHLLHLRILTGICLVLFMGLVFCTIKLLRLSKR